MRWLRGDDDAATDTVDADVTAPEEPDTPPETSDEPEAPDASAAVEDEPAPDSDPSDDGAGKVWADDEAGGVEVARPARVDVPTDLGQLDPDELERATRRAVARALAEDLSVSGDLTSVLTVPATSDGTADVVARAEGVVAGVDVARVVFAQVDSRLEFEAKVGDGDAVSAGDLIATISGPLRAILIAERTALNFLGHLSGIATQTRRYVDALDGTGTAIRDTRKTTPGLRLLEKAAVKAGGGANHRIGLYDALMVKDNHALAAGGVGAAAQAAMRGAGSKHVQVEVSRLDEIDEVLRAGVTDILLDNFTPDEVRAASRRVAGRAALEASGNITLETVRRYAEAGADRIASGALTHSAAWLDIALDVRTRGRRESVDVPDDDEDWSLSGLLDDDAVTDEPVPELVDDEEHGLPFLDGN